MTTIVTRAGKGSPLTNTEMDTNLTNLNSDKLEVATAAATYQPLDSDLTAIAALATLGYARRTGTGTWVLDTTIAGSYISGAINNVTLGLTTPAAGRTTTLLVNASGFSSTEVFRVTGASYFDGAVGIYGVADPLALVSIGPATHPSAAPVVYGVNANFTLPATAIGGGYGFLSTIGVAAGAAIPSLSHYEVGATALGGGASVNSVIGLSISGSMAVGLIQNRGIVIGLNDSALNYSIITGTAPSLFGGRFGVGQDFGYAALGVNVGSVYLTGTHQIGVYCVTNTSSAATARISGYRSYINTAAAAYTTPMLAHFYADTTGKGAGHTITVLAGFYAADGIAAGSSNYGFWTDFSSAAGKRAFYASSTALSEFTGGITATPIGATGPSTGAFTTLSASSNFTTTASVGIGVASPTYPIDVQAAATAIGIRIRGRAADDLAVLSFSEDSGATEQGRISVTSANAINFSTGSAAAVQVSVTHVASAVNYINLAGATTTSSPFIAAGGSDSNITLRYIAKGTGNHDFYSVNGANRQFRIRGDNVAVNYLDVFGTTTGNGPIIRAEGSDSNIRLNLYSKGTDAVIIGTNQGASVTATFIHVASAVNYLWFTGNATGLAPQIRAEGTDTNIALTLSAKGTGAVNLYTGSAARLQASVLDVAGANRYVTLAGSNSGNPTIGVSGGSLALSSAVIGASTIACTAGTGTGQPVLIGRLYHETTEAYNNTTGADDLMSYSLPASSFSANNKAIRVTMAGTFVNTAGAKGVRLVFGANTIVEHLTFPTLSLGHWRIEAIITRTGASAQTASAVITITDTTGGTSTHTIAGASTGESTAGAITIKGQAQSTGTDDIYQHLMLVEFIS